MPAYERELAISKAQGDNALKIGALARIFLQDELTNTEGDISKAQLAMGLTTLIAIIVGLLVSWRITQQITRPLNNTLEIAQRIATGDLRRVDVPERRDELGKLLQAMATMNQNLRDMIEKSSRASARFTPPPVKSPPAIPISPRAPSNRRRRWRKPPPAWSS